MRLAVIGALALTTGCSAIFMEKLPKGYDATKAPPHCSGGKGFVAWDSLIATADIIAALAFLAVENDDALSQRAQDELAADRQAYALLFAADALIHIISATKGNGWADECRRARGEYEVIAAKEKPAPVAVPIPALRGFFCAGNATVGTCAREKGICEAARDALAMAAPDVSACSIVESAWCFDAGKRCAPTEDGCVAQRGAAQWTTDACVEAR